MDFLPIIQYLEDEDLGKAGTTLFANFMPVGVTDGVMFRLPLAGVKVDPNLPGYYKVEVTMVVRATNFSDGQEKAKTLMTALTMYDKDLDGLYIKRMYPCTLPISFPLSDGNLYEIQVKMDVVFLGEAYGR